MSYYYELEPYLEEFLDYGLGSLLLSNSWSSLFRIATYVLTALALYTMAQRRGIKNPWLSWIPVVNCWILGSLSDQYRYVVKGEVKNKRKVLLILNIISMVMAIAMMIIAIVMVFRIIDSGIGSNENELMWAALRAVGGVLVLALPLVGVGIATMVVHFMALYDIYTSCVPQNNVLFLVLSILFGFTEPFFLFFSRNQDEGMPPRKQEPVYAAPQEPVYAPAQEPWENVSDQ